MLHNYCQCLQLLFRFRNNSGLAISYDAGIMITVLAGQPSLHQFMAAIHLESHLRIFLHQFQLLPFTGTMVIQYQPAILQAVAMVHRHDIYLSLIHKSDPAHLAGIQYLLYLFNIRHFPVFPSHTRLLLFLF